MKGIYRDESPLTKGKAKEKIPMGILISLDIFARTNGNPGDACVPWSTPVGCQGGRPSDRNPPRPPPPPPGRMIPLSSLSPSLSTSHAWYAGKRPAPAGGGGGVKLPPPDTPTPTGTPTDKTHTRTHQYDVLMW